MAGRGDARVLRAAARLAAALASGLVAACAGPRAAPAPAGDSPGRGAPAAAAADAAPAPSAAPENDAIVVAGRRFSIGTRVVSWDEPPYFSAYARTPRFDADAPAGAGLRFRPGRAGIEGRPELASVQHAVDQLVLHFDVCGASDRCFRVLHDVRKLSVHFLLDVDGTLYQTLDLRDQAWHATKANPRSVGVEIANIGAYPTDDAQALWDWYGVEPGAASARVADGGVEGDADVAFVAGVVQGQRLVQAEFTPAQMDALVKLAAGLSRALPRIRPDAPRDAAGRVVDAALGDAEFAAFQGILGHFHVQTNKVDPGPAFRWEEFLSAVRAELARP
jgi:N-acetyl-anhydromuramyl-L-alanine amidase AmpD